MKKHLLLILALGLSLFTGACSGGDDSPSSVFIPESTEAITFKFNGVYKAFENVQVGGRVHGDASFSQSVTATEKGKPSNKLSFKIVHNHADDKNVLQLFKYTEDDVEIFYNYQASAQIWRYDLHVLKGTFSVTSGENEIREGTLDLTY